MQQQQDERAGPIALDAEEFWSAPPSDDMPTVEDVVSGLGLEYRGAIDAPSPLLLPDAVLSRLRRADQEMARLRSEIDMALGIGLDLLAVDRTAYDVSVDLDAGRVTLTPRTESAP